MKKKLILFAMCLMTLPIAGCGEAEALTLEEKQQECDHEWEVIFMDWRGDEITETLCCSKCELHKEMSLDEWKEMKENKMDLEKRAKE